jgi:hypothetical protein
VRQYNKKCAQLTGKVRYTQYASSALTQKTGTFAGAG